MAATQAPQQQWTILDVLRWTTDYFQQKQIDAPRLTAELLLAHSLKQDRMSLYVNFDQPLDVEERAAFKALIKQRIQGVPTQYVLGTQEFWSLEFQVTPDVLIPRPETEHLVEAALETATASTEPAVLDIGTGSGCIAISLKHERPHMHMYAGDVSEAALRIARQNAACLLPDGQSIHFRQGDLFAPFADLQFDLIVSNPPYIAAADYDALAREIKEHEPKLALHAGEDGLDIYRRLTVDAAKYLRPGGQVLVEIGYGQSEGVITLFEAQRFTICRVVQDYAGIDRVLVAARQA